MDDLNELIKKYHNNFKEGKIQINKNKDQAYIYFKNSLSILENLKKKYPEKINKDFFEDSENECIKYLNFTIDSIINSEKIQNTKIKIEDLIKSLQEGDLDLIKSIKTNEIDFKELYENNTILHWAIKYGDTGFLKQAFKLGARIDTVNKEGHTLLEYACCEQDPNIINFLVLLLILYFLLI